MDRNMKGGGSLDHINEQGPLFANWQWLVVFLQLVADLAVYQGGMSSRTIFSHTITLSLQWSVSST